MPGEQHLTQHLPPQEANRRTAVVTGGSRGIGLAVVRSLLVQGWTVYFCSKSEASVRKALDSLTEFGDRARAEAVDVGQQDQVNRFIANVLEREGRIDCLVNNAGIRVFAPVDEISGDDWRRLIDTNLNAAFYFVRAVVPTMREQGSGMIFNIGSLAARHAFAGGAAYNASKFALLGFSEATMLDLRQDGIRVVAVLPGSVDTEFHPYREGSNDWMLQPEDVAQLIVDFLRYPSRALPSHVEIRPRRTAKS